MGRASQLSTGRDACFIVRDANGQALACVYFEEELGRRAAASALPPPRRFRACWSWQAHCGRAQSSTRH
jgi:hypothetical protein